MTGDVCLTNCESGGMLTQKAKMPTLLERINARIEDKEHDLAELKKAKTIVEKNPDIGELLNILGNSNIR